MDVNKLTRNYRVDLLVTLILFLMAVILFSLSWDFCLGKNSGMHLIDGVSTVGAQRVLGGEIPYRDFWTMYAPGQFYLLALVFGLFGSNLMVEVMAASVVSAVGVSLCYGVARSLTGSRWLAVGSAAIFLAAMYNTGYYQRLGSYPTGMVFVFLTIIFVLRFFRTSSLKHMFWAGLACGVLVLFKHDVGIYTSMAVAASLATNYLDSKKYDLDGYPTFWRGVLVYLAGAAVVVIPVLFYFLLLAGKDMIQNLIVFPLTDFRYARPEGYPSLLPMKILAYSGIDLAFYIARYFNFGFPFFTTLLGLIGIAAAIRKRNWFYVSTGVMLAVAFVFHYYAAHIQINTHIVSMSVYASWSGIILYELLLRGHKLVKHQLARILVAVLVIGWFTALILQPGFNLWKDSHAGRVAVDLGKFSGFKLNKRQAEKLEILKDFVDANVPPGEEIYVGNHRHDVIIVGDTMVQYLLDRPLATRYHELHPAISDTAERQQEMIDDLQKNKVSVLVLKRIFADSTLEKAKADFQQNLPHIGSRLLDTFILENYEQVKQIGPYTVWQLKKP